MSQRFCRRETSMRPAYWLGSKKSFFNEMKSTSDRMAEVSQASMLAMESPLPFCQSHHVQT